MLRLLPHLCELSTLKNYFKETCFCRLLLEPRLTHEVRVDLRLIFPLVTHLMTGAQVILMYLVPNPDMQRISSPQATEDTEVEEGGTITMR